MPTWEKCPSQLRLNGKSYKLGALLWVNELPDRHARVTPKTGTDMRGVLVLDPRAPDLIHPDWVWMDRGQQTWNGPLAEPEFSNLSSVIGIAGCFHGGPPWSVGPVRVRARIRHNGKTHFLGTLATVESSKGRL